MSAEASSTYKKFKKLKLAIKRSKIEIDTHGTRKKGSFKDGAVNAYPSTKRKRIYPVDEERRTHRERDNTNDSFKKGSNRLGENERSKWKDSSKRDPVLDKNKPTVEKVDKSNRTIWVPPSNKNNKSVLESKQIYRQGREKTFEGKFKAKGNMVERREPVEVESVHSFSRKKFAESKSDATCNRLSQTQGRGKRSNNMSLMKKSYDKKNMDYHNSSVVSTDDQLKKRKRIRLDPHDTSNKRIDDDRATNEKVKEEVEKDDTLSMNAQFRAIKPSPSILSFVEDNFLGRRRMTELQRAGFNIELPAPLDNIPSSTSTERERIVENLFRNKLTFFAAAKVSSSFPPPEVPEIAFAGRSNVGKSSLLNSLTRQWGVVRTSDKPGLTQTINFFKLGPKACLVDLPGYGFAYAKDEVRDAWEDLVKEYVSTRVGLKQVCLLIDTKWGMKPRDHELIHLMESSQTKYQIVLTKTDTVFPIDVARRAMQIEETLKARRSIVQPVMMVSSKSGAGIQSLRTVLSKIARFSKF